jgi:23S rRNA (uracil1939-C5)-methyltransferase
VIANHESNVIYSGNIIVLRCKPEGKPTPNDLESSSFPWKDIIFWRRRRASNLWLGQNRSIKPIPIRHYELYKVAREFADIKPVIMFTTYTQETGTIANFVCSQGKACGLEIEYVPEAIEDAKVNTNLNGIQNTSFLLAK